MNKRPARGYIFMGETPVLQIMLQRILIIVLLFAGAVFAGDVKTLDGHTYTGPIRFEDDQIVVQSTDKPVRLSADEIDQLNFSPPAPASSKHGGDHSGTPASMLIPPDGHGWLGSYYDDANLASLLFSRVDPNLDLDWRGKRPDSRLNGPFSASWMGNVTPPVTGNYHFNLLSRGGVRLTIDGKLLVDRWKGNNVDAGATLPLTAGRPVTCFIEYTSQGWDSGLQLLWSYGEVKKVPVPVDAVMIPAAAQRRALLKPRGLLGQYFDDETFTTERLRRHDATLNFHTLITNPLTWPDPKLPEKFAARWTGRLTSPGEGTYTLLMDVDDNARLFLDGKPVIDCWNQHSGQYQASFAFHAGQTYDFKLEYSNRLGHDAALHLMWSGHGHHMEIIDSAYFAPPAEDTFSDPRAMLKLPGKAIYVEGETIDLATDVSVDDGDHIREVDFLADDQVIGSATQAPYVFHWANPPTGRHEVLAQAMNDKGFKGRSARYQLTVTGKAPAVLGDGWMDFRVGDPGGSANTSSAAGTAVTVSASTGDLWSNSDAFHYVFHQLDGDGSLTAQVNSIQSVAAGDLVAAGIMLRRDLSAASSDAVVMEMQNSQPGAMFLHRDWAGGDPAYNSASSKPPCWLRVERAGNHVRAFLSATGEHWIPAGETDIQPSDTMYVGLVVACKGAARISAVFDHVTLRQGVFDARPFPPGLQEINGTVLTGDVISTNAEKINFRFHGKLIDIKPNDVARVLFRPLQPAALEALDAERKGVLLASGDLAEGEEIEYRDGRVMVSSVLFGKQNFGLDAAVAIIINDPVPGKTGYTITANDGCVYHLAQLRLDGDKLIVDDALVGPVTLNSGGVRSINRLSPR